MLRPDLLPDSRNISFVILSLDLLHFVEGSQKTIDKLLPHFYTKVMKEYYVYILANKTNSVLYIGVTNDLTRRVFEHKNGLVDGFTKKYKVHKLVYYETTTDVNIALNREKELKSWIRARKNKLIESTNPEWKEIEI